MFSNRVVYRGRKPAPAPPKPKLSIPKTKVLLIGNNYCGTPNELSGCVADIDHARAWFLANVSATTRQLSFYELSDSRQGAGKVVAGKQGMGTGANILAGLAWLLAQAKTGDVLYVHYSGHGSQLVAGTADPGEVTGLQSTWVPVDYKTFRGGKSKGLITDDELRALTAKVPAGVTLWVTSDSCFSGTVLDLRFNFTDTSSREVANILDPVDKSVLAVPSVEDNQPSTARAGVTVTTVTENTFYPVTAGRVILLSGSTDLQTSADTFEDARAQGAASWALFSCLTKDSKAPLKILLKNIRGLLGARGYTQVPQLSSGNSINVEALTFAGLLGC